MTPKPDLEIWITGIIGPNRRARQVGEKSGKPAVRVLLDDGTEDPKWSGFTLRGEDFGIVGEWKP